MAEPGAATLPFVAGPPGPPADVLDAATRAAAHWHLAPPQVVRIAINGVFTCDDVILRVSRPTAPAGASLELARMLLGRGLRVPAPRRDDAFDAGGGIWVTAWSRLAVLADRPVDWRSVGAMVRTVHSLDPHDLPASYPLPWSGTFPWWRFDERIEDARDVIDEVALDAICRTIDEDKWAVEEIGEATSSPVVCHGDVHPGNVLVTRGDDGPATTALIDWDLMCWGSPGWDHAMMITWTQRWGGELRVYEAFADGYGKDLRDDPVAMALSRLRLAAATFGRVDAARTDPSAGEELQRRLRWWRGDAAAPAWRPS